jgi:hypothetical protein
MIVGISFFENDLTFYNNISKYTINVFGGFYNIETYLVIGANNNIIIYKN